EFRRVLDKSCLSSCPALPTSRRCCWVVAIRMGARSSCLSGQRIGFRGKLDQLQLESFVNGQVALPLRIGDGDLPLIRLEGLHQPFAADISRARVLDPEKAVVMR